MNWIIAFCAAAFCFSVALLIDHLRIARRIKQRNRHKPTPTIQSTAFPEDKMTFNEWANYIHHK